MKRERARGFTMIELLVVVAIIGLLATIVLASLSNSRRKARDARRVADVKELENAVHLYVSVNNGLSPAALANLVPTYIPAIPPDPSDGTNAYGYVQSGG